MVGDGECESEERASRDWRWGVRKGESVDGWMERVGGVVRKL